LEGTVLINHAAATLLIADGGTVDKLIGADLLEALQAMEKLICREFNFKAHMLKTSLDERGVKDPSLYYPYRDDAVLYWDAIETFVQGVLSVAYPGSDADTRIKKDTLLQDWSTIISNPAQGHVNGFGEQQNGERYEIVTLKYLVSAVTMIIFTASVQHAAVNFPQADMMVYIPGFPLRNARKTPNHNEQLTEGDWLNMLPNIETAKAQLAIGSLLGGVNYNPLTYYDHQSNNADVKRHLKTFKAQLQNIGNQISKRNSSLAPSYQYTYLLPENIPQSINI